MNFKIQRDALLKPLQTICGVVERRQTLPILSHVLLVINDNQLTLTATDLEVEMIATTETIDAVAGEITVPARKFLDICRTLPEDCQIYFKLEGERAILRAGKSRFTLSTLPASDFPNIDVSKEGNTFTISQASLKSLIDHTQFAMAQQDVRYYLNGLMLEIAPGTLRSVATDGHRLAMCEMAVDVSSVESKQIILPRKGIAELARLLDETDNSLTIEIGANHVRIQFEQLAFTSKLIDGKFPDYQRVLPQNTDKNLVLNRETFRQALIRASILSNEKYRGIRLLLENNSMKIIANNPEQEEAEEQVELTYTYDALEIGFNVTYLLDALKAITTEEVNIALSDSNSSCLITAVGEMAANCRYVVMPMRL